MTSFILLKLTKQSLDKPSNRSEKKMRVTSSRSTLSTEKVGGQPGRCETLSQNEQTLLLDKLKSELLHTVVMEPFSFSLTFP